jgi:hypothetical protein
VRWWSVAAVLACAVSWVSWWTSPNLWTLMLPLGATAAATLSIRAARRYERLRARAELTEVQPPQNVRLERAGHDPVPLECVYHGQDPDGIHTWVAVGDFPLDAAGWTLRADVLPARTSIVLTTRGGNE